MTARTLLSDSPGGVTRLTKRAFASDSGGVVRGPAKRILVSDAGGVTRLVFANQVVATAFPATENKSGFAPITLTTGVTTVTATGGIPPYTYSWSFSSGGATISITDPHNNATAFTSHMSPGDLKIATAMCTVTDSIGDQGFAFCSIILSTTN